MNTAGAPQNQARSRQVWGLAWPTILSNLLFTTVGFMHIKIVAALGTSGVAAVTTGHRVFFLVQAILMGLSVAATALVARSWGAQDQSRAEAVVWTSLMVSIALAACLSLPLILAPRLIASLFGLDDATTTQAARFIFWLGVFHIPSAISLVLSTALRATGDVITPLLFLLGSSLLNILFGYSLAFGLGPLPALGVAGVALGGSGAAALVTCLFVTLWWRGHFNLKPLKAWRINLPVVRQLAAIGYPAVIEQGVIQLAFLLFFSIVARYGTPAFAAYGIGISLVSFSIVVGFGFGLAAATLVGQQLGAGQPQGAIGTGWRAMRMAVGTMVLLSLVLAWFARPLAEFMIDEGAVVELTVAFIYMIAVVQPIMALEVTLGGALRGAGDTRFPLFATLCGIIAGRLLPALLLAELGFSVYWIFSVMILDYGLKAGLMLHRFRSRAWLDERLAEPARD